MTGNGYRATFQRFGIAPIKRIPASQSKSFFFVKFTIIVRHELRSTVRPINRGLKISVQFVELVFIVPFGQLYSCEFHSADYSVFKYAPNRVWARNIKIMEPQPYSSTC